MTIKKSTKILDRYKVFEVKHAIKNNHIFFHYELLLDFLTVWSELIF